MLRSKLSILLFVAEISLQAMGAEVAGSGCWHVDANAANVAVDRVPRIVEIAEEGNFDFEIPKKILEDGDIPRAGWVGELKNVPESLLPLFLSLANAHGGMFASLMKSLEEGNEVIDIKVLFEKTAYLLPGAKAEDFRLAYTRTEDFVSLLSTNLHYIDSQTTNLRDISADKAPLWEDRREQLLITKKDIFVPLVFSYSSLNVFQVSEEQLEDRQDDASILAERFGFFEKYFAYRKPDLVKTYDFEHSSIDRFKDAFSVTFYFDLPDGSGCTAVTYAISAFELPGFWGWESLIHKLLNADTTNKVKGMRQFSIRKKESRI